jgi:hypothetical protein
MNRFVRLLAVPLLGAVLAGTTATAVAKPPTADGTWQKIEDPAPVTVDGKTYRATCSGYPGTDPRFSFWARKGTSKNTVVYFEGGGACWDNLTCTFPIAGLPPQVPQFFMPSVPAGTTPSAFDGIFRTDRADNPVRDWNVVYIPYCTGDLHAGSATRQYVNVGHPVFPLPTSFTIEHRGFDNFMVVLDWMKRNLDTPKSLLVAGSSAGGYGASLNFPYLARAYPTAHMYVVADASQGVTTPGFDGGTPGRGSWNLQFAPGVFGDDPASVAGSDLLAVAARSFPRAKVAQFTTALDTVQIGFYGVMKQFYGPGGSCPDVATDWYQQMVGKLQRYASEVPNFRHYLAAGTYHTLLRSPLYYTEDSAGTRFNAWLDGMLRDRGGIGGVHGGWKHATCPTCVQPTTCP